MSTALASLLASTQKSVVLNMYGYDDDELNEIILAKLNDERVLSADELGHAAGPLRPRTRTAEGGKNDLIGNSIAIGTSPRARSRA
jgi:hypothetical protein